MHKKPLVFIAGLAIAAITMGGGCIQMEHDLQINADGSAAYRVNYAISEQAVDQFRAMFKLRRDLALAAGEQPEPDPDPVIMTFLDPSLSAIRAHLLAMQEQGITIRSLRENTRSLWRDYTLVLDIEDISRLPDIPFFAMQGFSLTRNTEDQFVLDRNPMVTAASGIPPAFSEKELDQIRPFLAGFTTEIKIQVPGRIVTTTAGRTSLQTAIWSFHFDRQPEAVHQLMQQQLYLVFHAPTADLPLFSIPNQTDN